MNNKSEILENIPVFKLLRSFPGFKRMKKKMKERRKRRVKEKKK